MAEDYDTPVDINGFPVDSHRLWCYLTLHDGVKLSFSRSNHVAGRQLRRRIKREYRTMRALRDIEALNVDKMEET